MDVFSIQKAERLFKKHRKICQPGSGIVAYRGQLIHQSQYIKAVLCKMEDIICNNALEKILPSLEIALQIDVKYSESESLFIEYFSKSLKYVFESNQTKEFIFVLQYSKMGAKQLIKIVKFLQTQQFIVFIKLCPQYSGLKQYQTYLYQFSRDVLEVQMLLLSAISIILELPSFDQENSLMIYSTTLISIWKRTLPISLGSIIINDWQTSKPKVVFDFHFLKGVRPCWMFQFLTTNQESAELLGCQCIGID